MELYIKKSLRRFSDGYPVWEVILNLKKQYSDLYDAYNKLIEIVKSRDVDVFDYYMENSDDFNVAYDHFGAEVFWTKLLQLIRNCIYIDNKDYCLSNIDAEVLYERLKAS